MISGTNYHKRLCGVRGGAWEEGKRGRSGTSLLLGRKRRGGDKTETKCDLRLVKAG